MARWLARIFFILALVAAGYDAIALITGRAAAAAKVGDWWAYLNRDSLLLLQPAIERHVEPYVGTWLWDPTMLTILTTPAWIMLGVIGLTFVLIERRRPPWRSRNSATASRE